MRMSFLKNITNLSFSRRMMSLSFFCLVSPAFLVVSSTATTTSTVASSSSTTSADKERLHNIISLDRINSILFSEVKHEFGTEAAERLWNESMHNEWHLAEQDEHNNSNYVKGSDDGSTQQNSHRKLQRGSEGHRPFLVCDVSGRTGEQCRKDLEFILDQAVMPIYNKRDMSCFVLQSLPSMIRNLLLPVEQYVSTPMSVEMKLHMNMVDEIITASSSNNGGGGDDDHNYSNDYNQQHRERGDDSTGRITGATMRTTRIQGMFCPGEIETTNTLSSKKDDALALATQIISNFNRTNILQRRLRQQRFLDTRQTRHQQRQQFWNRKLSSSFTSSQSNENEKCQDEVFDRLHLEVSHDAKTMTITLNHDNEKCIYELIIDLAMQHEICFVSQVLPAIHLLNNVASDIIQSGRFDRQESHNNNNNFRGRNANINNNDNINNNRPFHDVGLNGTGQIVALSDSGIDVDNCYFWDSANTVSKDTEGTVNFSHRKVIQYYAYADDTDYEAGHGTHTAATIAGHRSADGSMGRIGNNGGGQADGIAIGAKLAFYDMGDSLTRKLNVPSDIYSIMNPGYQAGAKIHSASWGVMSNFYTLADHELDVIMYQNPDFLFVAAAGNSGFWDMLNTVGTPAINKNGIAVGATQNGRPHTPDGMRGPDYLAWFSSRGPTMDGRIVPHVLAPGYYVQSARAAPDSVGECDDTAEAGLDSRTGTSMAAPMIAGAAAIIRQYFVDGWLATNGELASKSDGFNPRASLVKAVLINGAQPLRGIEDQNHQIKEIQPYDFHQGFGRINLLKSLPLKNENRLQAMVRNAISIQSGQVHKYEIMVDKARVCNEQLSVTLAWTDPIVAPFCANCVLNDLDLYITKSFINSTGRREKQYHFPNGLDSADDINNVERVRIDNPEDGAAYVIHVEGTDLIKAQQYSLIVTGCFISSDRKDNGTTRQPTSPTPPLGSALTREEYDLPPTEPPTTLNAGPPTINPDIDCIDDPGGMVNITNNRMGSCDYISKNRYSYGFLCSFIDVARVCPRTCQKCQEIGQLPSSSNRVTNSKFDGETRWYGTKFAIQSKSNDVIITGIDIHINIVAEFDVEIYTKMGRFLPADEDNGDDDWELLYKEKVQGQGRGKPTTIPSLLKTVTVPAGEYQSFYITLKVADLVMVLDQESTVKDNNKPVFENGDLLIERGVAVGYKHGRSFPDYLWDGRFHYEVSSSEGPRLCQDINTGKVFLNDHLGSQTCQWIANNFHRVQHVCSYVGPAVNCPETCGICETLHEK